MTCGRACSSGPIAEAPGVAVGRGPSGGGAAQRNGLSNLRRRWSIGKAGTESSGHSNSLTRCSSDPVSISGGYSYDVL